EAAAAPAIAVFAEICVGAAGAAHAAAAGVAAGAEPEATGSGPAKGAVLAEIHAAEGEAGAGCNEKAAAQAGAATAGEASDPSRAAGRRRVRDGEIVDCGRARIGEEPAKLVVAVE